MIKDSPLSAEHDPVHAAAAEWFIRLDSADPPMEDVLEWQQWMAADELNAVAFARIVKAASAFKPLAGAAMPPSEMLAADEYDGSVPVSDWNAASRGEVLRIGSTQPRSSGSSFSTRRQIGRSRLGVSIAASLSFAAVGGISYLAFERESVPSVHVAAAVQTDTYETSLGDIRTVALLDGSSVTLGGASKVRIAFSDDARKLTLIQGEAYFDVAKDPQRPFTVDAGEANVTALGTQFNVRRRDDRVTVAVIEGRVMVEPTVSIVPIPWIGEHIARFVKPPKPLDAGNQAVVDESGVGAAAQLHDATLATSWQQGRLAFDNEPLRYVVQDVNRYASTPILIEDDTVGDLRITGAVLCDNLDGWLASLEKAFGLRVERSAGRIVLTQ